MRIHDMMTDQTESREPWTLSVDLTLSERRRGCVIRHHHAEIPVSNGEQFRRLAALCFDEQPEVSQPDYFARRRSDMTNPIHGQAEREIASILAPAIDVRAPYAKQMIRALADLQLAKADAALVALRTQVQQLLRYDVYEARHMNWFERVVKASVLVTLLPATENLQAGAAYTILDGLPKPLAGAPPAKEP